MENCKIGDRVTRRKVNSFRYLFGKNDGTVIEITYDNRCKIKWDTPADTGQQHSTIQQKFLQAAK